MKNILKNIMLILIICIIILSCKNKENKIATQNKEVIVIGHEDVDNSVNSEIEKIIEQEEVENIVLFELRNPPMFGQDIINLQNRLLSLGFFEIGDIDGYYGQLTSKVIKTIQYYSGFEQNEIVDKKLYDFLLNESNNIILKNISTISRYNLNELTKKTVRRMGYSTEGGHVDKYFLGDEIKQMLLSIYGETGKFEYYFYYIDSNNYFIIEKSYKYPFPIYYLLLDPNKLDAIELERNAYELEIIANGEFDTRTVIKYNTYLKDNNNLYQIKNGSFSETDFDLDELIKVIEDEEADW